MMTGSLAREEALVAHEADARPKVGFIVGPTGAGKTAIAIAVAERIGAEIVNADSRQVYRAMNIGTAKPTPEELRRVRHHLIDIRDPDEPLDVAEFARIARVAIAEIRGRGRPVIVVGGSGLYLRVLRAGIFAGPPADPAIRAHLIGVAEQDGTAALHLRLAAIDPAAAARISPNDLIRIVRALEVFELTGIPISALQTRHHFGPRPYTSLTVGVSRPRELLYASIDQRFDAMVAAGLIDEVRALLAAGHDGAAWSRTTGYREIAAYLRGDLDFAAAIDRAKRESRRLAKRQMTWFRAEPEINWIDAGAGADPAIVLFTNFFARRRQRSHEPEQS
jgi:tRNA dimethylallyltransferase